MLLIYRNILIGDVPDLQYKTYPGSNGETLGISVTEQKKGVPNGEYFTLSMAGVTSPLLPYDLSAGDVSTYTYTCISEIFAIILNTEFILNECLFLLYVLKVCLKELGLIFFLLQITDAN